MLGRIHCLLVSTQSGEVVFERFYDRLSEAEKADVRAAFHQAASSVRLTQEEQDYVGSYRSVPLLTTSGHS